MEMPADVAPSSTRKKLASASSRTCIGRSGRPTGRIACSGAVPRLSVQPRASASAADRAQRKKHPTDKAHAHRAQQTGDPDQRP